MDRNELIEELPSGYASILLRKLIERAVGEREEIHGFLKEKETSKPDGQDEEIKEVIYYVVTSTKFLKFHVSELGFGCRSCSLRSFRRFEEELTPIRGKVESWRYFLQDGCPGKYRVSLRFNDDSGFANVEFTTDSGRWSEKREELEDFVKGLHRAITSFRNG